MAADSPATPEIGTSVGLGWPVPRADEQAARAVPVDSEPVPGTAVGLGWTT